MDRAFQRIRSLMLRGTFYSVPPSCGGKFGGCHRQGKVACFQLGQSKVWTTGKYPTDRIPLYGIWFSDGKGFFHFIIIK